MTTLVNNREDSMRLRSIESLLRIGCMTMCAVAIAAAQTQDTSGNGLLKGNFNFRHVAVQNVDANFNASEVTAISGSISFDGNGNYTITGTSVDNTVSSGAPKAVSVSGTYAIGANGLGYITNELYPTDFDSVIYGAVAQGVFTGSSTESQQDGNIFNDLFVAIPAPSGAIANASFTQSYWVGLLDFTGGSGAFRNALFQLAPDGKGNLATITVNGQAANQGNSQLSQMVSGATYNFTSGSTGTLTIPLASSVASANALFSNGSKTIAQSADGNFILGWTPGAYDIFFGVKSLGSPASNSLTSGLYFTAAVEDTVTGFGTDSYAGSTNNTGDVNGDAIVHERFNTPGQGPSDYGTDDQILVNPTGTTSPDYFGYEYLFGDGGKAFVAVGSNGFYSLQIGTHAPAFSGSGVYINPVGVVNAASWQPITASLAPGELFTLFGTGLAAAPMSSQGGTAFPTTLGGVSVTIDGISCPIYYVTATQIAAIAPYELASNQTGLANIQVTNNGVKSNIVQMYLTDAAPGAFSQGANGIGYAAAVHAATGLLITPGNPAEPGEFISLFMTGLGSVTPSIADGAVPSSTTLNWANVFENGNLAVYFNDYGPGGLIGNPGNVQFAGLVPTLAGLYQLNVEVPSIGISNGDNVYIEFVTDAADVNQIQIPFGAAPTPTADARAHAVRTRARHAHHTSAGSQARPMTRQASGF